MWHTFLKSKTMLIRKLTVSFMTLSLSFNTASPAFALRVPQDQEGHHLVRAGLEETKEEKFRVDRLRQILQPDFPGDQDSDIAALWVKSDSASPSAFVEELDLRRPQDRFGGRVFVRLVKDHPNSPEPAARFIAAWVGFLKHKFPSEEEQAKALADYWQALHEKPVALPNRPKIEKAFVEAIGDSLKAIRVMAELKQRRYPRNLAPDFAAHLIRLPQLEVPERDSLTKMMSRAVVQMPAEKIWRVLVLEEPLTIVLPPRWIRLLDAHLQLQTITLSDFFHNRMEQAGYSYREMEDRDHLQRGEFTLHFKPVKGGRPGTGTYRISILFVPWWNLPLTAAVGLAEAGLEEGPVFPEPEEASGPVPIDVWKDGGAVYPSSQDPLATVAFVSATGRPIGVEIYASLVNFGGVIPELFELPGISHDGSPSYLYGGAVPLHVRQEIAGLLKEKKLEVAARIVDRSGKHWHVPMIPINAGGSRSEVRFQGGVPARKDLVGEHLFTVEVRWNRQVRRLEEQGWFRIHPVDLGRFGSRGVATPLKSKLWMRNSRDGVQPVVIGWNPASSQDSAAAPRGAVKPLADQDYWIRSWGGRDYLLNREQMDRYAFPFKPGHPDPDIRKGAPILDALIDSSGYVEIQSAQQYEDPTLAARLELAFQLNGILGAPPSLEPHTPAFPKPFARLEDDAAIRTAYDHFVQNAQPDPSAPLVRVEPPSPAPVSDPKGASILVLSLNGTRDLFLQTREVDEKLRLEGQLTEGGGPLAAARGARNLGVGGAVTVVAVGAGRTGLDLIKGLERKGFQGENLIPISVEGAGETRVSVNGRISQSPRIPSGLVQQAVKATLERMRAMEPGGTLVIGERLAEVDSPEGSEWVARTLVGLIGQAGKLHWSTAVAASSSWSRETCEAILAAHPYTFHIDFEAFARLSHFPDKERVPLPEEIAQQADDLRRRHGVSQFIVSLGEAGEILISEEGWYHAVPSPVLELTYVTGARDVVLGALTRFGQEGLPESKALHRAVVAGILHMEGWGMPVTAEQVRANLHRARVYELLQPAKDLLVIPVPEGKRLPDQAALKELLAQKASQFPAGICFWFDQERGKTAPSVVRLAGFPEIRLVYGRQEGWLTQWKGRVRLHLDSAVELPSLHSEGEEDLVIRNPRDEQIAFTLIIPHGKGPHPVAVLPHGYARSRQDMRPIAIWFADRGYGVIIPDLRNNRSRSGSNGNLSAGSLAEFSLQEQIDDLADLLRFLKREVPQADLSRLVLAGHSAGGVTCQETAKAILEGDGRFKDLGIQLRGVVNIAGGIHLPGTALMGLMNLGNEAPLAKAERLLAEWREKGKEAGINGGQRFWLQDPRYDWEHYDPIQTVQLIRQAGVPFLYVIGGRDKDPGIYCNGLRESEQKVQAFLKEVAGGGTLKVIEEMPHFPEDRFLPEMMGFIFECLPAAAGLEEESWAERLISSDSGSLQEALLALHARALQINENKDPVQREAEMQRFKKGLPRGKPDQGIQIETFQPFGESGPEYTLVLTPASGRPSFVTGSLLRGIALYLEDLPEGKTVLAQERGAGHGLVSLVLASSPKVAQVQAVEKNPDLKRVLELNRLMNLSPEEQRKLEIRAGDVSSRGPPVDLLVMNPSQRPAGKFSEPSSYYQSGPDGLAMTWEVMGLAPQLLQPGGTFLVAAVDWHGDRFKTLLESVQPGMEWKALSDTKTMYLYRKDDPLTDHDIDAFQQAPVDFWFWDRVPVSGSLEPARRIDAKAMANRLREGGTVWVQAQVWRGQLPAAGLEEGGVSSALDEIFDRTATHSGML